MPFYTFIQNNSGGSFDHDATAGIGLNVIIEANNEDHAIERAENIGLYLDGVDNGQDCPCCGDRWSRYCDEHPTPQIYDMKLHITKDGEAPLIDWEIPSYIHPLEGPFSTVSETKAP